MPTLTEGFNLGDLLKYEAPNLYSRDKVSIAAGQTLQMGAVVGAVSGTGKFKRFDPSAEDGSQDVAGIVIQDIDAALIDRENGLIVARHAIVADHVLNWPTAITAAEKAAAIKQLKALGILVRKGV